MNKYIPNSKNTLEKETIRANIKFFKFLETFRPDLRVKLQKSRPTKFQDAVDRAKNIEVALNSIPLNVYSTESQSTTSHSHEECKIELLEYE